MATSRQIEANRQNALLSTGPRTAEGKAASRRNAVEHGLAGESDLVAPGVQTEFERRVQVWREEIRPRSHEGDHALERAVAATIRIEECEAAFDTMARDRVVRAWHAWEDDRGIEAARLLAKLPRDPVLVSRELEATRQGAELMIEVWSRLIEALHARGEWTDFEVSTALDLLGLPAGLREGRTRLDPPAGVDPADWLNGLARAECDRLQGRIDSALADLDAFQRQEAGTVAGALLTKAAALLLRYERDAWRRFRASMSVAKAPASSPETDAAGAAEVVVRHRVEAERPAPAPAVKTGPGGPSLEELAGRMAELREASRRATTIEEHQAIEAEANRLAEWLRLDEEAFETEYAAEYGHPPEPLDDDRIDPPRQHAPDALAGRL